MNIPSCSGGREGGRRWWRGRQASWQ